MLDKHQILRRHLAGVALLALLAACGQKGSLVIPSEPAASQRATLPQAIKNDLRSVLPFGAASAPAASASASAPAPAPAPAASSAR